MSEEQNGSDSQQTLEELQAELERTKAALKKANGESADRRKRLEEYESRDQSEAETIKKITEERDGAIAALRTERIKNAVFGKASELGFEHPGDAFALVDLASVEVAEDGKVSGFEKSLEALAKSGRLKMKKSGDNLGNKTTPTRSGTPSTTNTNTQAPQPVRKRL